MPRPGGCLPCQGAPATAPGPEPRLLCRLLHLQTAHVALRGGSGPTFMVGFFDLNWFAFMLLPACGFARALPPIWGTSISSLLIEFPSSFLFGL